jgi:hypothetical protein
MPGQAFDLGNVGYLEEEFLFSGLATSFVMTDERSDDGKWHVKPHQQTPFVTRLTVRRPQTRAQFSGTVFAEWNNVSGGIDASPDWTLLHRHLIRRGHAWVGVTAQKVGVDGGGLVEGLHLKKISPERYRELIHPGDAWSFDIFSQAARVLRTPGSSPLGTFTPARLIAIGESQSAMYLVTYINAIDSIARVYDGFFVHGRGSAGAPLDGAGLVRRGGELAARLRDAPVEGIREDARVPVLVLQSETDVVSLGGRLPCQSDSERLRLWEIAGAAHADTYLLIAGPLDDGRLASARFAELLKPTTNLPIGATDSPINAGPQQHYVGHAAIEALDRWARGGPAPPSAARLEIATDGRGCKLDNNGNALGGVRTPWVEAPTAVLSGFGQSGGVFGFLFGTTKPLDAAKLARLYPGGKSDYLARFVPALDDAISKGFLLAEDREEIAAVAAASFNP